MIKENFDFSLKCFNVPKTCSHDLIEKRSKKLGFDMCSDHETGALISTLVSSKPNGRILELGTGTGTSTAWILEGMCPSSTLISIDYDADCQQVAIDILDQDNRVTFITGDAIDFLTKQTECSFDLIFADAEPGKYYFLEETLKLLKPGGLYIVDDMLLQDDWSDDYYLFAQKTLQGLKRVSGMRKAGLSYSSGLIIMTPDLSNTSLIDLT